MGGISDERLIETPDAPEWGALTEDDAEEAGELGQLGQTPRRAAPAAEARPARRGPLPGAVGTWATLNIELPRHLQLPLGPWTEALPAERQEQVRALAESDQWVLMVTEALDRDMRADDARDPDGRHYNWPLYFDATYGALRDRGAEAAARRRLADAMRPIARGLWDDPGLHLTADRMAGLLACTQDTLADWLGVTPERLAVEDAARQQAWISTVDIHSTETEADADA